MPAQPPLHNRVLFGAAFYDEYRVTGTLDRDLDLMIEAGFSVIRVGESVWSTWEPRPGEFDLEWIGPVLDGAAARGIDVVLGTPTYAVPAWLQQLHPDIAAQSATGQPVPWGQRQEIDYTHPDFRRHADRVIRAIMHRWARHPAVIGFQVDNEPGLHLLHNPDVFTGFQHHLRDRYGTVDELNRAWGLTYWSHRLTDWSQLWAPDGNHSPQYQLEWRRYQAQVVDEFISWQADIVREYSRSDQFVTTCISYERLAIDDEQLVKNLDVTAGNPYYKMQDGLRIGVEVPRPEIWWSSGVWGLYQQGDRLFSSAQAPFLVTETNAQSIGQSQWQNHPPYPGQIALAGLSLIARGARMVEYWQWQTLHAGIETYWGGVLPHSGQPGRIYREVADLGATIRQLEPSLIDFRPDADIALLYSTDTKRSFEFYPPLPLSDGSPDPLAYLKIFDSFYRGAFEAGAQARVVHTRQFVDRDPQQFAQEYSVLVVPTLYVADDAALNALVAYAEAGGHVIIGIRTGYGDELARARAEIAPGPLRAAAGVHYEEYTTLDTPVGVTGRLNGAVLDGGSIGWADKIEVDDADVVATYTNGPYSGLPAITTRRTGRGRVTYVGTVPDRSLALALMHWAVPSPLAGNWLRDPTVTVTSGTSTAGRVWFLSNWSPSPARVRIPVDCTNGTERRSAGDEELLQPWASKVLVELTALRESTTSVSEPV